MQDIIVVTSYKEQEEVMRYLTAKLHEMHHTDITVSITKKTLSRIDVWQRIKGMQHLAASYILILIPITVQLDAIKGFPHSANININRVLERLDTIKAEIIAEVNARKYDVKKTKDTTKALKDSMNLMFS